ncbi:MAG: DNA polymerase III subunit gamma/tau [Thermodesulfobacteriota bacterium]
MSSYLVIARKWRPSIFEEIIGQDHVTRTLRNAISTGRVAQAYLFSGPRGVGKTTAARILAKSLNCTGAGDALPCDECSSCREITAGSSVDVLEIDGASNTGVENVRDLRENIMYMPAGGKRKIYIIDEVHMLSISAFNALLKTLEEPPPHVVFIFATTEVGKIPLTILSRCQRFEFRRISLLKIESHLKKILIAEKIDFEEDALFAISREADGSLRDAESLLDQVLAFGRGAVRLTDVTEALGLMDRTVLLELMDAIIKKDGGLSLNIIEKIYNFGYDLKKACGELLAIVRDMTAIKVMDETSLIEAPVHELERLKAISALCAVDDLHMLFLLLQKGYGDVTRSDFARHAFEMTVLRASSFDSLRPLEEIIKGMNALGMKEGGGDFASPAAAKERPVLSHAGSVSQNNGFSPSKQEKGASKRHRASSVPVKGRGVLPWEEGGRVASKAPSAGDGKGGTASYADSGADLSGKAVGEQDARRVSGAGQGAAEGQNETAVEEQAAGEQAQRADVAGLMGHIKEHNISLHGTLKAADIEIRDNIVEIKTDLKTSKFLKMQINRLERAFSDYLKTSVKVALKAELAGEGVVKDPADAVIRALGGKVLEDSYGGGG